MTSSKALTFICLAIAFLTGCNKGPNRPATQQASTTAKRYHLKGEVVSIDKQGKMANIDSEAIPDFMGAMTMPYSVKPESQLDQLKPGDAITADVVVQDESAWLENITVVRPAGKAQETGTVKWFNDAKGYGFISRQSGEDIFVHHSAVQTNGYRSLQEGQQVSFNVVKGSKGLQAENVRIIGATSPAQSPK